MSYSKIPADPRSVRLAKLQAAGKASNERRVKALERQAEAANKAIDLLQQSLDENKDLLGCHCLPLSNSIAVLKEFATLDLASKINTVQARSVVEPEEFYSWVGGGGDTAKAVKAYLAGKEVTPKLKEQLASVGIDPALL